MLCKLKSSESDGAVSSPLLSEMTHQAKMLRWRLTCTAISSWLQVQTLDGPEGGMIIERVVDIGKDGAQIKIGIVQV